MKITDKNTSMKATINSDPSVNDIREYNNINRNKQNNLVDKDKAYDIIKKKDK